MGDGVLVYFGYPQAHEDNAERPVRAGLELVAAVSALRTHAALQTRVGIATGLLVVGDLIKSDASQEQAIVGETPNLAARLQGMAEPNRVVIAEGTRKLLGNLFELEDLGAKDLKGVIGPVRAWAALRPAIEWWRTAAQRSLIRASREGAEQIKRALAHIATLPATPDLRREEIKLHVAFANALTLTGDLVNGKEHYDRALAIYDPAEHGPLTTRSGRDVGV